MKKSIYLLVMICSFFMVACSPETDDIFGESSSARIGKTMKEELKVLTGASNGWLLEYFPQAQQAYGGYNVLLSFTEDGQVTVAADVAEPTATATSLYKLRELAGPTLSFDTYNDIFHFFSDPASGVGQTGLGMGGDYDFTIMSATSEQIVLKGRKSGNKAVMTPVPEGMAWADYLKSISAIEKEMPYKNFITTAGNVEFEVSKGTYRTLVFTHMEGDEVMSEELAYIQRPNSIKFYSSFKPGNGKEYSELMCDKETGNYVSEDGSLILEGEATPLNQLLISGSWYMAYSKLGTQPQLYFDKIKENYETNPNLAGEKLYYWLLGSYKGGKFGIYFGSAVMAAGSVYTGGLYYDFQLSDEDKIVMKFAMDGDSNGVFYHNKCGFNYGLVPFGYSEAKTFKLTADNLYTPTEITLTEVGNSDNVMTLSSTPVNFPFDN